MNWIDIDIDTIAKFAEIFSPLVILLIGYLLNKQIKKSESNLTLSLEKRSKLHALRLDKINDIYSCLNTHHRDLQAYFVIEPDKDIDEIQKLRQEASLKAIHSFNDFSEVYENNKYYFTITTCELIETIKAELSDSTLALNFNPNNPLNEQIESKKLQATMEKLKITIPDLKEKLENNLRKIIGVEEK
jgi:hypothetical protein